MTHVVIIGAGIIGLASARELASRGVGVTVLERGMVAAGTSSRGEGNLLVSDKLIPAEAALALRSLQLWETLAAQSAEPFEHEPKGGIITATTDRQLGLLTTQAQRQRQLGITSSVLDMAALRDLEPHLSHDVIGGLHYPQDAQVMPIHAVRALARAASDLGVEVRTRVAVNGVSADRAGVLVRTSRGILRADAVVNAAGPWAGEVAAACGGHAAVFPRRGLLLVTEPLPAGVVRHKVYDGRYIEAVASDEAAAQVAPVVESTASGTVLIGSTREAVGWDEHVRWDLAGHLARLVIQLFPDLATAHVMRTYQGFRPATPDHLPLIGPDAVVDGLFHHTGHEGAGIGLALGSAELLADAVLGGHVVTEFDPRRFAPPSGTVACAMDELGVRASPAAPPAAACRVSVDGAPEGDTPRAGGAGRGSAATDWLSAGRQSWRRTRFLDRPRGLFCGIGHCHDCVVTDQFGETVRACMTPAGDLPEAAGAR
ncbi:MAG TPA: FAD-dependent oxidoreductase [Euzebya sp.]|nr:FAD-dependent oxidoreductase [Euzebya sp.]